MPPPLLLSHAGLRKLPPNLESLSIHSIVLHRNTLKSLRGLPHRIQHVNARENYIDRDGLLISLPHCTLLDVENNDIELGEEDQLVHWFPSLQYLHIADNLLTTCDFLKDLALECLDMSNNDIVFVENLSQNLQLLNASCCEIRMIQSRLPSTIRTVQLSDNRLRFAGLPLNWGTCLRTLMLDKNNIEKFPRNLPDTLETLVLSRNKLTTIPDSLPKSLKLLNVNKNYIRVFNSQHKLDILQIADNCLTELPMSYSVIEAEGNWTLEKHHQAQKTLKKCWKRYVMALRLRHYKRTLKTKQELMEVSMSPERWMQVDTLSKEWFKKDLPHNRIDHH